MRKYNKNVNIILVVIIIVGILLGFRVVDKKISPIMLSIAQEECNKLSTVIINDSIKKEVSEGLTFDKLFIITYENGEIATIDFDSVIVNKALSNITSSVLTNLKYVEEGNIEELSNIDDVFIHYNKNKLKKGIIYELPLSLVYKNTFLSNLSPKVPVRIQLIGTVNTNLKTKVTDYGINNALIEVYAEVEVSLQVILPFINEKQVTKSSVPIVFKMVKGKVPEYFSNGYNNSQFSIPVN